MTKSGTRYSEKDAGDMKRVLYRQLCDHGFSAKGIARKLKGAYKQAESEGNTAAFVKILGQERQWYKMLARDDGDSA